MKDSLGRRIGRGMVALVLSLYIIVVLLGDLALFANLFYALPYMRQDFAMMNFVTVVLANIIAVLFLIVIAASDYDEDTSSQPNKGR